jgi:hypothetical protein
MRRTLIALVATAGAVLGSGLVVVEPAAARDAGTRVAVSVRPAHGRPKTAWLTCDPAGGSHRRADEACAALAAAGGDPHAIPPTDTMCTTEFAPVTATAIGRWRGRAVRYRETFGNRCVLRVQTGPLFRL